MLTMIEAVQQRRSIRSFKNIPVPQDMILHMLEAARLAPSASNRQPWIFIVIRDEAVRREVARHAAYYLVRWTHVAEAPLLIVLCGDAGNRIYRQFLHEDVALAGSQIMLQAKALGLGTCWIGGLDRKAIGGVLKLPDHIEIVGLLTVGFPAEDPRPRPRKPLERIAHYDVYGNLGDRVSAEPGQVPGGLLGKLLRRVRVNFRPPGR